MRRLVEVLVFAVGLAIAWFTLGAAIRSVILPRAIPSRLARAVFLGVRTLFRWRIGRRAPYERHDRIMAMYGPVSLLAMLATWLALVLVGYTMMFWAIGAGSLREAFSLSGSSLLTLGFAVDRAAPAIALSFTEATIGLILLAMLITYLPTIYGAFQRREQIVAMLEVRGGSPVSGVEMVERYARIEGLERLAEMWPRFERWFVELEESHTSFPVLTFFRSPQPGHSWVTTAGAILDGASLIESSVKDASRPEAQLTIRAGFIALRRIAAFFRIPVDHDPKPDDPISIDREEFDAAYDRLGEAGIEMVPDREQAWRDFAGWRVNYDAALIRLAALTVAPPAPWSSDERRIPPATYGQVRGLFERRGRSKRR